MRATLVALCVLVLAGCGGSDDKPLLAQGKAASVRGSLTPDVHLFAEPVVARIDVVVDRDQIDPADVVAEVRLQAVRDARRDGGRARGHRPVHAPPLHDDASLSQREVHPEHLQVQRRPDLADAGAAALSGEPAARREAEVRVSAGARGRRRGGRRQDPRPRRLAAPALALADQLVRLERRRAGLPVRSDRDATTGDELPDLTDARSALLLLVVAISTRRVPGAVPGAQPPGAPAAEGETDGRRCRRSSARSPSSSGRVDGPPSTSAARRSRRSPTSSIPRTTRRHVALEPRGGLRRLRQRTR